MVVGSRRPWTSAARAAALVLCATPALAACPEEVQPPEEQKQELRPRRPIDGLHGIETRSKLHYIDAPDEPRTFEAVYVFPDRARWEFELANGERRRVYRAGGSLYYSQGGPSRPLDDAQRAQLLGELELRRALLLWPHGFEWKDTEEGPEADLGPSGRIRATLDPETELPLSLALYTPRGQPLESFRELVWRTDRGRRWPATLQFWQGGSHLWNETIERAAPARYVDVFFTPADRRASTGDTEALKGELPLQPFTAYRIDLPDETTWEDALERELRERERWAKKLPEATLAAHPTFVLGETGRPVAALLRIEPPLRAVPEGWTQQPARRGIASFTSYETLEQLDRERVAWMRSLVPDGAEAQAAYARVDREAGRVQLVQPFVR